MATELGAPTPATSMPASPPATRAARPGWRDPRLWIGLLIVAVCVVAGARIIGAADDTVGVWALTRDVGAGDTVDPGDLVATRVHFADAATESGYFTLDDQLPADLRLTRGVAAGELLPRAAVGTAEQVDTLEVPLAVEADQVPGSVTAGSVVDVYLLAGPGGGPGGGDAGPGAAGPAGPALAAVTVVDAPPVEESFTADGKRQLVLAVAERDARRFFALLGATEDAQLTVVRRG